jgi:hypothetical protein
MIHRLIVHLAETERGNSTMYAVACLHAADREQRPLIVTVVEHAWWLSYLFDVINAGTIVGTANDAAVFTGAAKDAREKYGRENFIELGWIRRPRTQHG